MRVKSWRAVLWAEATSNEVNKGGFQEGGYGNTAGWYHGCSLLSVARRGGDEEQLRNPSRIAQIRFGFNRQSRSSSLRLTRPRVFSSTCLMMMAQYKLWLPSGAGRAPGTTTEPAGTRP